MFSFLRDKKLKKSKFLFLKIPFKNKLLLVSPTRLIIMKYNTDIAKKFKNKNKKIMFDIKKQTTKKLYITKKY